MVLDVLAMAADGLHLSRVYGVVSQQAVDRIRQKAADVRIERGQTAGMDRCAHGQGQKTLAQNGGPSVGRGGAQICCFIAQVNQRAVYRIHAGTGHDADKKRHGRQGES